jgi:hypothetical protein
MAKSNVTHLKDDIDSGRTGDKAPGFDPAAAPLGTDEEAAGTPPSAFEIEQARRLEDRRLEGGTPNGVEPDLTPDGSLSNHRWRYLPVVMLGLVLFAGALAAAAMS